MIDEESILEAHITEKTALDLLKEAMDAKWPIAPLKGYEEIMKSSFNDITFNPGIFSKIKRFFTSCVCCRCKSKCKSKEQSETLDMSLT